MLYSIFFSRFIWLTLEILKYVYTIHREQRVFFNLKLSLVRAFRFFLIPMLWVYYKFPFLLERVLTFDIRF